MAKYKRKTTITSRQKSARRKNIAVARSAKKKGATASQKAKSKRMSINTAANILRKRGAKLGVGSTKLDKATGKFTTKYKLTTKSGKSGWVTAQDLRKGLAKYL